MRFSVMVIQRQIFVILRNSIMDYWQTNRKGGRLGREAEGQTKGSKREKLCVSVDRFLRVCGSEVKK